MAICKACGRDIATDMMFCPYCGTKRILDVSGRPIEEKPEHRVGVVPFVSGQGRLEGIWTMIVSDRRLVFAKALLMDETLQERPKGVGLGLLSRRGPDSGCGLTYAQRYQEMTPDEAMNESEDNFQIAIDEIILSNVSQKVEGRYDISMTLKNGELIFSMPQQHDHRSYLRTVLGDRLTW